MARLFPVPGTPFSRRFLWGNVRLPLFSLNELFTSIEDTLSSFSLISIKTILFLFLKLKILFNCLLA